MRFKNLRWTVKKLNDLRNAIDSKPQYQRGDAWDDRKRALLIDSILNNYDIPKIYLRKSDISTFDYEVADGQQRLKAMWKFLDNELILEDMSDKFVNLNNTTFNDLPQAKKSHILNYGIVTTVVYDATNDQIRELFRRLQLGVRLNPAELRNSMASALGNEIRAMALTHPFLKNSPFTTARYKADDLLAHAFAIVIYKRRRDVKAPDLREMYEEFAPHGNPTATKRVNEILHFLNTMQNNKPRCIKTKWGFVDLVGILANQDLKKLDASAIAAAYVKWEFERAEKTSHLSELAAAKHGTRQRLLFEYITAFQKEGATKRNLETRFRVLNTILL